MARSGGIADGARLLRGLFLAAGLRRHGARPRRPRCCRSCPPHPSSSSRPPASRAPRRGSSAAPRPSRASAHRSAPGASAAPFRRAPRPWRSPAAPSAFSSSALRERPPRPAPSPPPCALLMLTGLAATSSPARPGRPHGRLRRPFLAPRPAPAAAALEPRSRAIRASRGSRCAPRPNAWSKRSRSRSRCCASGWAGRRRSTGWRSSTPCPRIPRSGTTPPAPRS